MTSTVPGTLTRAADYLDAHGWCSLPGYGETGNRQAAACTVDALRIAVFGRPVDGRYIATLDPACLVHYRDVVGFLTRYLNPGYRLTLEPWTLPAGRMYYEVEQVLYDWDEGLIRPTGHRFYEHDAAEVITTLRQAAAAYPHTNREAT